MFIRTRIFQELEDPFEGLNVSLQVLYFSFSFSPEYAVVGREILLVEIPIFRDTGADNKSAAQKLGDPSLKWVLVNFFGWNKTGS